MARTDTITVNDSDMRVLVSIPEGSGPHPTVVVMCHIGGIDEFTEDRCDRLASAGYIAAAPDVFHYHSWIEDRNERRASLGDATIVDDIKATLGHLRAQEAVDDDRVAILGHCMGGRTALLGAGRIPDFTATVLYYGGRTMMSWQGSGQATGQGSGSDNGPTPFEGIRNIKGPVAGFFGDHDKEPPPEDVDKIEAEMKRCNIPVTFYRYADAGHAFQDHTRLDRYHDASAKDAWEKTLRFLDNAWS